jgi:Peptidase propeptide and YPEB domain
LCRPFVHGQNNGIILLAGVPLNRFSSIQMSGPMSKKQLFGALLSLLIGTPSHAGTTLDGEISAEQDANGSGLTDEAISRELELFRSAEISLRQALKTAGSLHPGSRIVDISFDAASGSPVYRVKMFRQDRIWADTIDAKTGQVADNATASSMSELNLEDRLNVIAMQSVRQELTDAVFVAEDNMSGKALSGGLMNEAGKLICVIVVLSRTDLKQVMHEPPSANNLETLPPRSKQH